MSNYQIARPSWNKPRDLTPIETVYKGYRFRSRLEARWALFFDKLSIKWNYEVEGYKLSNGEWYLPDFWLPTFSGGIFAEVKPDGGDFSKAFQLCKDSTKNVWLCEGIPTLKNYKVITCNEEWSGCPKTNGVYTFTGIPNWDQAQNENRFFVESGMNDKELEIVLEKDDYFNDYTRSVKEVERYRF